MYSAPDYVSALVYAIRREIGRVYWNINQKKWPGGDFFDAEYGQTNFDPMIEGIYWIGHRNEDEDEPNFIFDGVEFQWYKNFGRRLSCNIEKTPSEWVEWFDKCMAVINKAECDHQLISTGVPCYCLTCLQARKP